MNSFKKLFNKNTTPPIKSIPGIEPILVQAVEHIFPDANIQKDAFEFILELKERRKGVADLKTLLALLKYSDGDFEKFKKSSWQSHPHFWMDEISHIFRTVEDAENWVESLSESKN